MPRPIPTLISLVFLAVCTAACVGGPFGPPSPYADVVFYGENIHTVDDATALKFGEGNRLVWSVPFVVFGVGRYMLLAQTGNETT